MASKMIKEFSVLLSEKVDVWSLAWDMGPLSHPSSVNNTVIFNVIESVQPFLFIAFAIYFISCMFRTLTVSEFVKM